MGYLSAVVDGASFSSDPAAKYVISEAGIGGWFDGPPVRSTKQARPGGHGAFPSPAFRDGRVITLPGFVRGSSPSDVGQVRAELTAILADGGFGDLTVTEPDGTTTTASVQVNAAPLVQWFPRSNAVAFHLQFYSPDPLRYGPTINAVTGFRSLTGGLEFPLFTDGTTDTGYLEFGTPGSTGRVTVSNPGTAPAWPQHQVTGPTPPLTIACVETGELLSMPRALSAGETLLMDSATGLVLLNGGDVDYSGLLTRAEWSSVPAGGSRTYALLNDDGSADDREAYTLITRPAWW